MKEGDCFGDIPKETKLHLFCVSKSSTALTETCKKQKNTLINLTIRVIVCLHFFLDLSQFHVKQVPFTTP